MESNFDDAAVTRDFAMTSLENARNAREAILSKTLLPAWACFLPGACVGMLTIGIGTKWGSPWFSVAATLLGIATCIIVFALQHAKGISPWRTEPPIVWISAITIVLIPLLGGSIMKFYTLENLIIIVWAIFCAICSGFLTYWFNRRYANKAATI